MKTSSNKPKVGLKIYIGISAVTLLIAYLFVSHAIHWWPFHTAKASLNVSTAQTAHPSPKNNNVPTKASSDSPTGSQTSNQVPVDGTLEASITTLAESDGQVTFAGTVQNTSSVGTCVVTFSNPNDRPVTKQFNASYTSARSNCGPISIPASEFSYLGSWLVTLHYYTGDTQAMAQSTINIQ